MDSQNNKILGSILALFVAGVVLIFIHNFVRLYPRPWYFDQFIIVLILLFVFALSRILKEPKLQWMSGRPRLATFLGILVLLGTVMPFETIYKSIQYGIYPEQIAKLPTVDWIKKNIPRDKILGSFNSGTIAYLSDYQVVNLDGIVNDKAFVAIKNKKIFQYMKDSRIDYYVDYEPGMLNGRFRFFTGNMEDWVKMELMYQNDRYSPHKNKGHLSVYKLNWI